MAKALAGPFLMIFSSPASTEGRQQTWQSNQRTVRISSKGVTSDLSATSMPGETMKSSA